MGVGYSSRKGGATGRPRRHSIVNRKRRECIPGWCPHASSYVTYGTDESEIMSGLSYVLLREEKKIAQVGPTRGG